MFGERRAADRSLPQEQRGLITLDLDFNNPLLFRPADYAGIAVLRPGGAALHSELHAAIQTLIDGLARNELHGRLWIVQRDRIREDTPEDTDSDRA